ncbi:heme peroxidase [Phaeosphaeria sp. MPI-PUGE-AT-0046c]|nr:heme peroxidase [Phaeosphaeria sp. MPI-PUGE-AT-0046c]
MPRFLINFVIHALAAAHLPAAFPGLKNLMVELGSRQAPPEPNVPIGDLATEGPTTPVGHLVMHCLDDKGCQSNATYTPPGNIHSKVCHEDTCCIWDAISKELEDLFLDEDGTCNQIARASIRLGLHDSAAWSQTSGPGGADGSILLTNEIERSENRPLRDIRSRALGLLQKYRGYGYDISAADLVQFMHNVAVVACPLGPRILTFIGRKDSHKPNPDGLLPDPNMSATELIQLFNNKTITFRDIVALIGAHSTANQFFFDPSKAGQPLDSTPGIWDVKFYEENMLPESPEGVFRMPSDASFANDSASRVGFRAFADPVQGQAIWNEEYSVGWVRMSLLGVNNINHLTDCSGVLPKVNTVGPIPRKRAR